MSLPKSFFYLASPPTLPPDTGFDSFQSEQKQTASFRATQASCLKLLDDSFDQISNSRLNYPKSGPGNLKVYFKQLSVPQQEALEKFWGTTSLNRLLALASHPRDDVYFGLLWKLGKNLETEGNSAAALLVYQHLQNFPGVPANIKRRANTSAHALQKKDSWLSQSADALPQLLQELVNPVSMGSFLIGQYSFGASRALFARSLPRRFSQFQRMVTSNLLAFGIEGQAFTGSRYLGDRLLGNPHASFSYGHDLAHSYLSLGLMKSFGSLTTQAFAKTGPSTSLLAKWITRSAPQVSIFGASYLTNSIAPYLNLGEAMSREQNLFNSFISLVHMKASDLTLNLLPGWKAHQARLHHATHQALSEAAQALFTFHPWSFQTQAVTPEGLRLSATVPGKKFQTLLSEAINPPTSSPSTSPTEISSSALRRITELKTKLQGPSKKVRFARWLDRIGRHIDLNRFQDPQGPLMPLHRSPKPTPIHNIETGILLFIAQGEGASRQVAHARRVMDETRNLPKTRQAYLEAESNKLAFQAELRQQLDPILQKLRTPDYQAIEKAVLAYEEASQHILGKNVALWRTDALLNLYHAREITSEATQGRLFSPTELLARGFEPEAISHTPHQVGKFSPKAIEAIITHNSFLRNHPKTPALLKALDEVGMNLSPTELRILKTQLRAEFVELMSSELGQTQLAQPETQVTLQNWRNLSLEEIRPLVRNNSSFAESELGRQILGKCNQIFPPSTARVRKALAELLHDPKAAQVWLGELALQASLRENMRRDPGFLTSIVTANPPEGLPAAQRAEYEQKYTALLMAYHKQNWNQLRGPRRTLRGKDYQRIHKSQGAYERAALEFLSDYETFILPQAKEHLKTQLGHISAAEKKILVAARRKVMEAWGQEAEQQRGNFLALEESISGFVAHYDTRLIELREQGLRTGMTHVEELLSQLKEQLAPQVYQEQIAPRWNALQEQFESQIKTYQQAAADSLRGKLNPRDFNYRMRDPLKTLMESYDWLLSTAKQHQVSLGKVHRIVPFFENDAQYKDLSQDIPSTQRWRSIAQYALQSLGGVTRLRSLQHQSYPFSMGSKTFLNFGAEIGSTVQKQTFYIDSGMEAVYDYFRWTLSLDHNTILDTIGHSANLAQAALGNRATANSSIDFIARANLDFPIVGDSLSYLTNMIGDKPAQVAAAETRAASMAIYGSLSHGRLHPVPPALFDSITKPVFDGPGPYGLDAAPPVGGNLATLGRSFSLAEAASVLSGRPQGIVFGQNPGAIRNNPSQIGPLSLLRNPSSMVGELYTLRGLPASNAEPKNITSRNAIERLIWYLQGFHPSLDPKAPDTNLIYQTYQKPIDPLSEELVARLFHGASEVYPNPSGIHHLENQLRSEQATSANSPRRQILEQALKQQKVTYLRTELHVLDQRITQALQDDPKSPEAKGLKRSQRILQSRLKLLDKIDQKLQTGTPFDLAETKLIEKLFLAVEPGQATVSGDRIIEQLHYYFSVRDIGGQLPDRVMQVQRHYYDFVQQWTQRRQIPGSAESQQKHISEAEGYWDLWHDYRIAMESYFNLRGHVPESWEGNIFPDLQFRRDGEDFIIGPADWSPSQALSRTPIWRFASNDTPGMVSMAASSLELDPQNRLYLSLHRAWGHRMFERFNTQVRLQNQENFPASQAILASTHDSIMEFPGLTSVLHDYGIQNFFIAKDAFSKGFLGSLFQTHRFYHTFLSRTNTERDNTTLQEAGRAIAGLPHASSQGTLLERPPQSLTIFPQGTTQGVRYNTAGQREEGPLLASRWGIGILLHAANAQTNVAPTPVVPLGLRGGGTILPRQNLDTFLTGGAGLGREWVINVGKPIYYHELVPGNAHPTEQQTKEAIAPALDNALSTLTGRSVAPRPAKRKRFSFMVVRG